MYMCVHVCVFCFYICICMPLMYIYTEKAEEKMATLHQIVLLILPFCRLDMVSSLCY